jgi:hypothetical protein
LTPIAGHCKNGDSLAVQATRLRFPQGNYRMSNAPIPSVVAMLVCDHVITEMGTGKKSLIGVFENINSLAFPTQINLGIYAKLVDADGDYDILIRLVNLKDESRVADIKADAKGIKRDAAAELMVNLAGIVLPEPGRYEFQLFANQAFLHRVTMNAVVLSGGPPWPQPKSRQ